VKPSLSTHCGSVFEFKRGRHSKKPDEIRDLIKEWFPDVSRMELFCRSPSVGWDVWGNEVECTAKLGGAV